MLNEIITKLESDENVSNADLCSLLSLSDSTDVDELYKRAYRVKEQNVGLKVYFRGIIEMSNFCAKDCYYCGIRRSNTSVDRYEMSEDEIVREALWAFDREYGSIVIQAGERKDAQFIEKITRVLKAIKKKSNGELGVTLSMGEQDKETYQGWFDAGAHRYLLRIETSSEDLYKRLHPSDHDFNERKNALVDLRKTGYQVGTGVMIGLPGQTIEDMANDILFFREMDIDMIGMGPYIPHDQTPLNEDSDGPDDLARFNLGLKMVAVTRLFLKDVNIAATTALQALNPIGRELGLQAGANVVMPNLTDIKYRKYYQLYEGKPCLEDDSDMCSGCLTRRVESIGETVGFGEWGDSPHFNKRNVAEPLAP
ncbi:MAG: [FeFe] hydrogenase H-cluster radical SAM maturase HydE [Kiritimatiellae bacterium]|nr:[FeFe] hydrogenase H-cluster radical SAM maturase HydE [Kiritimatiellia bacterium]